ncbi:MAG: hypothetical protein HY689_12805 [Chloroflexi bacterium]|nr:hypothetical protein [Chloroflexota bacterium]
MQSSLIGKVEKAHRYAQERDRISFIAFEVRFQGENDNHTIAYREGKLSCDCDFYHGHGLCSHTMAMEKVLDGMLPKVALSGQRV